MVGLSVLSGSHLSLTKKISDKFKEMRKGDIFLLVGGNIPDKDVIILKSMGVAEVFTASTAIKKITEFIDLRVSSKKSLSKRE